MSETVVILGKRRPALVAATALKLPVVLVHDQPVATRTRQLLRDVIPADLDAPMAAWEGVAAQLRTYRPRAIIAASERTVRAAAWLRQRLDLPGASEIQALLTTDKLAMKTALAAAGVPVADFFAPDQDTPIGQALERLGLPMVLKEQRGYGGRGTRIAFRHRDLPPLLPAGWLAERLVRGVEYSVESFIHNGVLRFAHITEYFIPRFASLSPTALDAASERALLALNRAAIAALGLTDGITHLEAFLTDHGPVFGEIALRPPGGHLMNLIARAYGFDPWQAWLRLELGEPVSLPAAPVGHAAVFLLHPGGPGRIGAIHGWESARDAPGIVEASLHVRIGDVVGERQGSGQESGYLLATGGDRLSTLARLLEARRALDFQLLPA